MKGVLLAKARTNRWTESQWYLNFIKDPNTPSPLCRECNVNDTTEHIIDECMMHDAQRSILLSKLRHTGKVSDLLTEEETVKELADFLEQIEDTRKASKKDDACKKKEARMRDDAKIKNT